MYFVVEYQGKRTTVKASARSTVSEINHLAFGFQQDGDARAKDVTVIGTSRRSDDACAMMCKVWPADSRLTAQAILNGFGRIA